MVFTIVGCLFVKRILSIVSAFFYEIPYYPVIVKILPRILFREFAPAFGTLKVVLKAAGNFENCCESRPWMYTREIGQWDRRKDWKEIWCGFRNHCQNLFQVFSEKQAELFYLFFSVTGQVKHIKTVRECTGSGTIQEAFKQNIHL